MTIIESFNDKNIIAAISEKRDGSMRDAFLTAGLFLKKALPPASAVFPVPVNHDGLDFMATSLPGTYLTVTAADCPPVFLYDPSRRAIALLHCGWKPVVQDVVASAVRFLFDNYRTNPKNLLAHIGPGIGPCHFEVGRDVAMKLGWGTAQPKMFVSLGETIRLALWREGVPAGNIEADESCTYCAYDRHGEYRYFSHRREKSDPIDVQLAVFGMKK